MAAEGENVGGGSGGSTGGTGGGPARTQPASSQLAVSLKGQLPCVQCGYELKGVSILGVCPECGTAVRATLLAVVDPLAAELQPIRRPRMVAAGLLLWVGGFCLAAVLSGGELVRQFLAALRIEVVHAPVWLTWTVVSLVVVAGCGATLITRPHDHVTRRETVLAWTAVALHVPLAITGLLLAGLYATGRAPALSSGPLTVMWDPSPDRTLLRVAAGVAGLSIIVLMRPVARVLVARSLAIRTGRVDRQTLLATAAAISVVMAGDLLGLVARRVGGGAADWLMLAAVTVVAVGVLLLCIGLLGSLVDSVRIARAIVRPGPSIQQVLHGPGAGGSGEGGRKGQENGA